MTYREGDDVVITLERTPCFGTCPVYTLAVQGDGTVVYEGKDFVKTKGIMEISIPQAKIDQLVKESGEYLKRLKELRVQIEKRAQEKTIEQIYNDVFELLKNLTGKKAQKDVIDCFDKDFVKKGKFSPQSLRILNDSVS